LTAITFSFTANTAFSFTAITVFFFAVIPASTYISYVFFGALPLFYSDND